MGIPFELLSENLISTHGITEDTRYSIDETDAFELLRPERIDIAAKLIYIDARVTGENVDEARDVYARHIEAFSEGYYSEPGNKENTTLDSFFEVFDKLIDDKRENGFDPSRSLIPVGRDNIILDGAHRTACAIYFGKKVKVIKFPGLSVNFGYEYFRGRYLGETYLRRMADAFAKFSRLPIYCCCIWPVADEKKRPEAVNIIKGSYPTVIDTPVRFSIESMREFMIHIYGSQPWVGSEADGYAGVMGKVNACYASGREAEVVLFIGDGLDRVLEMKDRMRDVFMLDKHALHISDTPEEARLMTSVLFGKGFDSSSGKRDSLKAKLHWMTEKAILKTKQVASKIAGKLGIYSALHKLFNAIRGKKD